MSPSLWTLVAAALGAPMAALVLSPIDTTIALIGGAAVGIAVVGALVFFAPVVEVRGGELHAGRAHIPVDLLGAPAIAIGEDARRARGELLDRRSFVLLRGGIDGVVTVPVTDPDDPAPAWVISTRTPERLAAAIRRAARREGAPRQRS